MVWVHCAVEKHTSLGKIALEVLALEHETDGELDDKMMIEYDDNEACVVAMITNIISIILMIIIV